MKIICSSKWHESNEFFLDSEAEILWKNVYVTVFSTMSNSLPTSNFPIRYISYLDRYLLLNPIGSVIEHRNFWEGVVDFIAPIYEQIISLSVNRECLAEIFRLASLSGISVKDSILVDFGCGSGVIHTALKSVEPRILYGIEKNKILGQQARDKGLMIIESWENMPTKADLVVSTFALHMGCSEELFSFAVNVLKPGGLIFANCYKNVGVEHINLSDYATELSFSIIPHCRSARGPLFVAVKT